MSLQGRCFKCGTSMMFDGICPFCAQKESNEKQERERNEMRRRIEADQLSREARRSAENTQRAAVAAERNARASEKAQENVQNFFGGIQSLLSGFVANLEDQRRDAEAIQGFNARLDAARKLLESDENIEAGLKELSRALKSITAAEAQTSKQEHKESLAKILASGCEIWNEAEKRRPEIVAKWKSRVYEEGKSRVDALVEDIERVREQLQASSIWDFKRAETSVDPLAPLRVQERMQEIQEYVLSPQDIHDLGLERVPAVLEQARISSDRWRRRIDANRSRVRWVFLVATIVLSCILIQVFGGFTAWSVGAVAVAWLVMLTARPKDARYDDRRHAGFALWGTVLTACVFLVFSDTMGRDVRRASSAKRKTPPTVSVSFLNGCFVREHPRKESKALGSLGPGQLAIVVEQRGGWRRVRSNDIVGWVGCRPNGVED